MQEKFADRFAVGIIDADKRRPSYLNEFSEICSSTHIKLFRHSVRYHYIILIYPAADGFILSCAADAKINLEDYGLSPILKEFTSQTKNVMSNKDYRFKRLFKSLEDFGEMKLLQKLIYYLVNSTYRVSDIDLISIFDSFH